jgi:hypothetical protein
MEIKGYFGYGSTTVQEIRKSNREDIERYKKIDEYNWNSPKIDLKDKFILDIGYDFVTTREELSHIRNMINLIIPDIDKECK